MILLENGHFSCSPRDQPGRVSKEPLWTHRPRLESILMTFHVHGFRLEHQYYWLFCLMVHSGKKGVRNRGPTPRRRHAPRSVPGASHTGLRAGMGAVRDPLSLGTKIVAVGKVPGLADVLLQEWNMGSVCWCHQALQLESELGLLGHDQRKQMFDQTSENICFILLVRMQPAWPEVSAFG